MIKVSDKSGGLEEIGKPEIGQKEIVKGGLVEMKSVKRRLVR